MSALTDLFTAMANKIRSKTGTATTYTPLQMVSDGIDDVYAAGYDAGGGGAAGIPVTPSNASPVNLTTGDSYQMLADGYAITSYTNLTPSNASPVSLSDDTIYKTNGTGKAIASLSDITPSNSSPVSLSSGSIYKMGGGGRAVAGISEITPSDLTLVPLQTSGIYKPLVSGVAIATNPQSVSPSPSGTAFSAGIIKMVSNGYAYSSQPTLTETTLWTNSAPTANFAAQDVTLSQSLANFDYVKIQYAKTKSKTSDVQMSIIIPYSDFLHTISSEDNGRLTGALYYYSTYRRFNYVSNTTIHFTGAASGSTAYNDYCVPTKISGLKI